MKQLQLRPTQPQSPQPLVRSAAAISAALQQQFLADLGMGGRRRIAKGTTSITTNSTTTASSSPSSAHRARLSTATPDTHQAHSNAVSTQPARTLAQRWGLAEAPASSLSPAEWEERLCTARERGHLGSACAICQEPYADARPQTILSCCHVFHEACLVSFERIARANANASGGDGALRCPMCRETHYERLRTFEGRAEARRLAAVRIQAWWRGEHARRALPAPRDPERRRRFLAGKLRSTSHRLQRALDTHNDSLDAFFAEMDEEVSWARRTLADAELVLGCAHGECARGAACSSSCCPTASARGVDWERARSLALARSEPDCVICCAPLASRPCSLLSCSHVLHSGCLLSLERFAADDPNVAAGCPMCRATYIKTDMVF